MDLPSRSSAGSGLPEIANAMPRESEQLVTLPLIDRLTDLEPRLAADPPITRAQSIRLLKASLRRDLEWLFNTRANAETPPQNVMPEVYRSVFNYGLPDFSHVSMSLHSQRVLLQRQLETAIGLFEPRLTGVQVRMLDQAYEAGRALRFQVDGFLKTDPAPEHVSFDTVLDVPSGEYAVKGETGAR